MPGECEEVGCREMASMEPLFFKAENPSRKNRTRQGKLLLQWSRFFSKRKIETILTFDPTQPVASMEPLFFKAENNPVARISLRALLSLQWSRFFSKRKIQRCRQSSVHNSRFNGAAFFQSGKSDALWLDEMSGWLLQWSRFFSKRKITVTG